MGGLATRLGGAKVPRPKLRRTDPFQERPWRTWRGRHWSGAFRMFAQRNHHFGGVTEAGPRSSVIANCPCASRPEEQGRGNSPVNGRNLNMCVSWRPISTTWHNTTRHRGEGSMAGASWENNPRVKKWTCLGWASPRSVQPRRELGPISIIVVCHPAAPTLTRSRGSVEAGQWLSRTCASFWLLPSG